MGSWRTSVRIPSYSGPYFPAFGLNTDKYRARLKIAGSRLKVWFSGLPLPS